MFAVDKEKLGKQKEQVKRWLKEPDYPIRLRDYQTEFCSEILDNMRLGYQSILAVLATGGGKSVCFKWLAKTLAEHGYKILLLVPKEELFDQGLRHLQSAGITVSPIREGHRAKYGSPVHISTTTTFYNRMNKIRNQYGVVYDLIMYDEAHHLHDDTITWSEVQRAFPEAFHIGFTATPVLTSGKGYEKQFDVMVKGPTVPELEKLGFLCPPKTYGRPPIDTSQVRISSSGDFNLDDLEQAADQPDLVADLVKTWQDLAFGLKTVVYTVSPLHSEHARDKYNELGKAIYNKEICAHLDGKVPKGERRNIVDRFRKPFNPDDDSLLLVSNYGIITEGFDLPAIQCVQMARPTQSLALWLQMANRGGRPEEGKEFYILLDHAGNVGRLGYPNSKHEWGLYATKTSANTIIQCDQCGHYWDRALIHERPFICTCGRLLLEKRELDKEVTGKNKAPIIDDSKELVEINISEKVLGFITRINSQGYKNAYSWFINQLPSMTELKEAQAEMSYKPEWVSYAYREVAKKKVNKRKAS